MGSNQSTAGYSRLRNPSTDSLKKSLLGPDQHQMERPQVEKEQNLHYKNAKLHKEVKETKSGTSTTLKTNSQSPNSKAMISHPQKEQKTEVNLQKEVNLLRLRIAALEKWVIKQEEVSEIMKKIAALEKSVLKLTSTINEIKRSTGPGVRDPIPNLIDLDLPVPVTMEPNNGVIVNATGKDLLVMPDCEFQATDRDNEVAGCLVVIIFLLAILIGLFCC